VTIARLARQIFSRTGNIYKILQPIGMKKSSLIFALIIWFCSSCKTDTKETTQKDSSVTTVAKTDTVVEKGNNLVKSEAPDAETREDQGYAIPRQNDRLAQSPIDILTMTASKDSKQPVFLKIPAEIVKVENLGHTIQLDFKEGNTWSAGGKTYTARQFHFHTPSEHLIDGITYPMEMHIVSVLKDSNEKSNPSFLVIGILFKMGAENKFIKEFMKSIPEEEGKTDSLKKGMVKLDDVFMSNPKMNAISYYHYDGSLTTPPFTEKVEWIVTKQILEASPEQIFEIEKLEGNNARHVQDMHERKVLVH
jgi:carbonic anhydrase